MTSKLSIELEKDKIRRNFIKYTRQAFHMLPGLVEPRILDIGCGSGLPTIELAKLSNGEIIGLDIDQAGLDELNRKIEAEGLSDRVKTLNCSMFDLDFPEESFDIIWAEGSIAMMGFTWGLKEWRRFLKPKGYLVVHDELVNLSKKIEQISDCGYELLEHFILSRDIWWTGYFEPLQRRINEIRQESSDNPEVISAIDSEQREIDIFKGNPKRNSSVFFVMQKG